MSFVFFQMFFQRGSGRCFFCFSMVSGFPGGVTFGGIFAKCAFFQETVVPSILNDSTAFWLDFEGSVLPETSKIDNKTESGNSLFF